MKDTGGLRRSCPCRVGLAAPTENVASRGRYADDPAKQHRPGSAECSSGSVTHLWSGAVLTPTSRALTLRRSLRGLSHV